MTADEIKALRLALGLTQVELANRLGVRFATVNRWENGRANPSPLALLALETLARQTGEPAAAVPAGHTEAA